MEEDLVYNALKNLEEPGHICAKYETSQNLDGYLIFHFPFNNEPIRMVIEVKKEIRQHQIPQLLERKLEYENFLLVAGRLHPAIKKRLQEEGIAYLEENGGVFIIYKNTYVLI